MKKVTFVRTLGVSLALLTLSTTTALANSSESINQVIETTEPKEDTLNEFVEEIDTSNTLPSDNDESTENSENTNVDDSKDTSNNETPEDSDNTNLDDDNDTSNNETPEDSDNTNLDDDNDTSKNETSENNENTNQDSTGEISKLDIDRQAKKESLDEWIKNGYISQKQADFLMAELQKATTQDGIDKLFTTFYDKYIATINDEYDQIVKDYEDEIASWVTAGYITSEMEYEFLTILNYINFLDPDSLQQLVDEGILTQEELDELLIFINDMDPVEYMDFVMEILRFLVQSMIDDIDGNDPDIAPPGILVYEPNVINPKPIIPTSVTTTKIDSISLTNNTELPQTGQKQNVVSILIGLASLGFVGTFYLRKETE